MDLKAIAKLAGTAFGALIALNLKADAAARARQEAEAERRRLAWQNFQPQHSQAATEASEPPTPHYAEPAPQPERVRRNPVQGPTQQPNWVDPLNRGGTNWRQVVDPFGYGGINPTPPPPPPQPPPPPPPRYY